MTKLELEQNQKLFFTEYEDMILYAEKLEVGARAWKVNKNFIDKERDEVDELKIMHSIYRSDNTKEYDRICAIDGFIDAYNDYFDASGEFITDDDCVYVYFEYFDSIIDLSDREEYEKETGKYWSQVEEHMAEICSFYEYGFNWNNKGNIVINNGYYQDWHQDYYKFFGKNIEMDLEENEELDGDLRHYEYESAEAMVNDWIEICKATNEDYVKNGQEKPFKWC